MMKPRHIRKMIRLVSKEDWMIAIPDWDDSDEVKGMVIGEEGFVDYILGHLPEIK